jgi:hypothetical protein
MENQLNDGEERINEANLRYLSQFHPSHVNKLLSALASDLPLDPIRIRETLPPPLPLPSLSPAPTSPAIDQPFKVSNLLATIDLYFSLIDFS